MGHPVAATLGPQIAKPYPKIGEIFHRQHLD